MRKTRQRILSLALALALMCGLCTPQTHAAGYSDTAGHWAEASIERWSEYNIVEGYDGAFSPDDSLTRGQMAKILAEALGLSKAAANPFSDVPSDAWYTPYVLRCYAAGIMLGADGKANPDSVITRQEAMVMFCRALEIAPDTIADLSSFTDGDSVASWAAPYLSAAVRNGIINGVGDNQIGATSNMTRASFMTVLDRAVVQYINAPGSYTLTDKNGIILVAAGNVILSGVTHANILIASAASGRSVDFNGATVYGSISLIADNVTVTATDSSLPTIAQNGSGNTVAVNDGSSSSTKPGSGSTSSTGGSYDSGWSWSGGSGGGNSGGTSGVYYTVTFNANGGTVSSSYAKVASGSAIGTLPTASRVGYTFLGWYTEASGGTQISSSTIVNRDITIYAHWSAEIGTGEYRIVFEINDGSRGVYQIQRLDAGETVSRPEDPTRELYGFTGWYLETAATTEYDFDTPVVSDLTLYAGWGNPNPDAPDDELYMASNETETISSITDIAVSGNDVIITYNTNDVTLLVVEFFPDQMTDGNWTEENLSANFTLDAVATASGYTEQYGELVNVTLPINGTLPENYLVRASMYDSSGSSIEDALATYITARYTNTYATFDALTVDDFVDGDDEIINFDDDDTTNFGVLNEDVIVIPIACQSTEGGEFEYIEYLNGKDSDNDGEAVYTVYDDENMPEYGSVLENLVPEHGYKFPDKDAVISGDLKLSNLQVGDIIYIEGTTYMFKIGSISIDGNSVTFTQDANATITDFYDVLKVDFEGIEADPRLRWDIIDVNASGSASLGFGLQKEFPNGVKVSGSISGKVTGKVSMFYDAHLFSADYFEANVSFVTEITGTVKAEVSNNNDNEYKNVVFQVDTREISLPTFVTGLDIYIKPTAQINWKLSGDVSVTWSSKQTSGFKYNSDTGRTDIAKKENTVSLTAAGKAEIKIGPIIDIGIKLFGGVLKGGVVAEAGAKFTATLAADLDSTTNADSMHACTLCFTGEAKWYAEASAKVQYKITDSWKGDIVNAKILSFEAHIEFLRNNPGKFFVSIVNDPDSPFGGNMKFGGGDCTNKAYRTEFKTQNQNGQDISGIPVSVVRQGQTAAKTGESPYVVYLYDGTYNAFATMEGSNVSKTVAVSGNRQTVVLSKSTADALLEGTVVDANNRGVISSASVTVSKGGVVVASALTGTNGRFSIAVPEGSLTVEVSKQNYTSFSSMERVYEGEVTHPMGQIELNPGTGMGGFRGEIQDATNNQPIEGVVLMLYKGWNNAGSPSEAIRTLETDANGKFRYNTTTLFGGVIGLSSGNYTLLASKEGYTDTSYNIVIYPGTTDESPEIIETMSPEMNDDYYRIVLTWGVDPRDLDSHLVADTDLGGNVHVYFSSMNPDPNYANLDTDDTDSYGPETITITNFEGLSNIRYAVHDYTNRDLTNSNALANSGAVVRLYKGNQLLRTFNVPTGYDGTEWDVFTLDANGRIVTINSMTYAEDPGSVLSGERAIRTLNDTEPLKDYELFEAAKNVSESEKSIVEDTVGSSEIETEQSGAGSFTSEEPGAEDSTNCDDEFTIITEPDFVGVAA